MYSVATIIDDCLFVRATCSSNEGHDHEISSHVKERHSVVILSLSLQHSSLHHHQHQVGEL